MANDTPDRPVRKQGTISVRPETMERFKAHIEELGPDVSHDTWVSTMLQLVKRIEASQGRNVAFGLFGVLPPEDREELMNSASSPVGKIGPTERRRAAHEKQRGPTEKPKGPGQG